MSGKVWLGIDPGKGGSISAIVEEFGTTGLMVKPTPVIQMKTKREYDVNAMRGLLMNYPTNITFCVLEKSQAMPGQGVTSMFSIGKGYGIWLGLLSALMIPFIEVHPATWSKQLLHGQGGDGKDRNFQKASQLFPSWQPKHKYEREWADSILLAEYGRIYR